MVQFEEIVSQKCGFSLAHGNILEILMVCVLHID